MLFNSYAFIFGFLPVTLSVYFLLTHLNKFNLAKSWLVGASLYFYSYWSLKNLPLLLLSIFINYVIGQLLLNDNAKLSKKALLRIGLVFNLGLLGFFKYADFFIWNINFILNLKINPILTILPLGISFFTLQQIAYLIDSYEGMTERKKFIDYISFVSFFPQIISGPISGYSQLMPQIDRTENKKFNLNNFSIGVFLFVLGLTKKVLIAETFSDWAKSGFDEATLLDFLGAWKTSLSYTFQLYFDFSGYTDMAIGIGYFFNIKLPQNFNSPLRSKSIIEFWTRWHMTLSQFINTYVFTPLVRSMPKINFRNTMIATFLSMFIAGIWHGAGWTFTFYGIIHGLALVINHYWKKSKRKLSPFMAWLITFNFINISFVFFRAKSMRDVFKVLRGMIGLDGVVVPKIGVKSVGILENYGFKMGTYLQPNDYFFLLLFLLSFYGIFTFKNSIELEKNFKPTTPKAIICGIAFAFCLFGMNKITEFIYFKF